MNRAIVLSKQNDQFHAEVREVGQAELEAATPGDDVTIDVAYSTINYKDGLALTNTSPVVRKWPMVAGIDAAGTVVASDHPRWRPGDLVVLNGWGIGESHWGGLCQRMRAKGEWLVRIPAPLRARETMIVGTAGYTAALAVLALRDHGVTPTSGEILVTGATGGVGSVAVALLASLGYTVVASTGKVGESDYLRALGAKELIDRSVLSAPDKPLQKERWAGAIDSVGGVTLANVCAQSRRSGTVAACGLAGGMDFPATVAPFILRGVTLVGIDSVMAPIERREAAWNMLATQVPAEQLAAMAHEVPLAGAFEVARDILAGRIRGRTVVDVTR